MRFIENRTMVVMTTEEFQTVKDALFTTLDIVMATGSPDDGEPDASGADVFEMVCNAAISIQEAVGVVVSIDASDVPVVTNTRPTYVSRPYTSTTTRKVLRARHNIFEVRDGEETFICSVNTFGIDIYELTNELLLRGIPAEDANALARKLL